MSAIRVVVPGQVVHLTDQIIRGKHIFTRPGVAAAWLDCLTRACEETDLQVLHFCVMSNHTHLLARSPSGKLADPMWHLKTPFARHMQRGGFTGHVFAHRYWDTRVVDEEHLVNALRYISRNPIDAGIVRDAAAHRWSAHRALVGEVIAPSCLALHAVQDLVGGDAALVDILSDLTAGRLPPPNRRRPGPPPSADGADAVELVQRRGLSLRDAADRLAVSEASVRRALARVAASG